LRYFWRQWLAGHLPILQYCADVDRIEERSIAQVAIAMFDDQHFSSTRIPFAPAMCSR
jgi:hypothetical protein